MKLPWLCVVSVPRSGTNQVLELLRHTSRVQVHDEWFRPQGPSYATREETRFFSEQAGIPFKDHNDPAFGKWTHANVARTLDLLEEVSRPGTRLVTLKIFDDHLPRRDICTHLFPHPKLHVLVIKRAPIDSYISLLKAEQNDIWLNFDTTHIKPSLEADAFLAWHAIKSDWFAWAEAELAKRQIPTAHFQFEEDIAIDPHECHARLHEALRSMGLPARQNRRGLFKKALRKVKSTPFGRFLNTPEVGLTRQDTNPDRASKVANWSEFCSDLKARDGSLEKLDAFSSPVNAPAQVLSTT